MKTLAKKSISSNFKYTYVFCLDGKESELAESLDWKEGEYIILDGINNFTNYNVLKTEDHLFRQSEEFDKDDPRLPENTIGSEL